MNDHGMGNGFRAYHPCVILLLLIMALTPSAAAADTMFRANPLHTGVFDNGGIVPNNTETWRFATGGLVDSSPAVSNGVVYVGSYDKNLYAIDAVTGKEQWRFATGGLVDSSPAVVNGVVYVGSYDKNLYAIDAVTGKEQWRFATGSEVRSSPAVVNGVVYVGSDDSNLYAIDAVMGKEKWRFATGGTVLSSPAVVNGVIYVGSYDKNLYAIDAVTGKEQWRFKTRSYVHSSPAVVNGVVYVGSLDETLYAIDAVPGTEKWRFATGNNVYSSPAISNGVVYVGSRDTNLYAIDAVTGKEQWRFKTGNYVDSSPAVVNGVVYVGSDDNNLYAIDAVTGKEQWRFATGSGVYSSPAVSMGVVFVGNWGTNLYAVGQKPSTPITTPTVAPTPVPTTPVTQPPTPVPTPSNSGNFNVSLPIIALLAVLFLAGGGYAIYRMMKKPSDDQPPERKEITAIVPPSSSTGSSSEGWNPASVENLLNRIASVEQKASALSQFRRQVQSLITKAREQYRSGAYDAVKTTLNTAEDDITILTQCETQIAQWKNEGYTTTSLESLKTDNLNTINIAFRNYELDLATLKQHEIRVQELKRSSSTGNANPVISQRITSIDAQLHDPCNIPDIGREIDAIEQQILRDQQERSKQQKETEQLLTRLHTKAEKLTRYAPLTTGSFAEAHNQIAAGRYNDARKTLAMGETAIDALLECESSLAAWQAKGYTLTELEGLHPLNADELIPIFKKSKQNINRLDAITQELESKKISYPNLREQPEIASVVLSIEQNLKNPALIDTVEKDYQQLIDVVRHLEDNQKIIEQNLRDQAEKVQREAGSSAITQEIAPIMKSIRQHDIPHAKEMLINLAEKQLSRVNTALSKLRTDGAVVSLSSDTIREQIAAQNYGGAIINSEQVIAEVTQILDAKQKIIEQNIRNQAEKVQREAGSSAINREIDPVLKSIRQHDIPRAQELLQDLAGQQLTRVNAALSKLRTDGAVVSFSSDAIRDHIAAQNYGNAILDSEQAISELTRVQEMYAKAKVLKSTVTDPEVVALYTGGKYEEFIRVCSEWQERRRTVIELKERASATLANAGKLGRVPKEVQEKLASEKIADIESAIKDLDTFAASAQPALILTLDHTRLAADKWHKVRVQITNDGDAHAFDVSFSFSSEFETRWIKPTNVEAGKSSTVEIGILPKKEGSIPLEITVHCRDGHDKPYDRTHEFWIDVVDRMSLTPEKDAAATPAQSPVSAFTPRPLTPKQLPPDLSDRYTESEFIGKGGFARVFKAKRKDGKYVAVKIPISLDASTGRSFIAEMQNWTKLSHTNIVKLYDFNIMPSPYFEMELCDSSLAERKKPIETEEAAWILFNVCEGLKFTHARKIIHRDLKPQNILLKNGVPKISDWGLSRVIAESTSTTAASFTPYYAAPEQISSEHKDERTDIWQLGVIFYELMTGQLPFTGDSIVAVMAAIATKDPQPPSAITPSSHDVEAMIMKCLEKNPGKRYQSVLEFQKDLALYLRVTYTESLKMSVSVQDYTRSAYYCGDLVMVNLLTGDMKSAYKYLLDLIHYSKGDVKVKARELSEQILVRMEYGIEEIPDELITKAEIIVHRVSLGFRNRG